MGGWVSGCGPSSMRGGDSIQAAGLIHPIHSEAMNLILGVDSSHCLVLVHHLQ